MSPALLSAAAAALLLLFGAHQVGPAERVRPLARFPRERVEIREWMKSHDWQSKRNSPRRFELGDGRLHLVSQDDSVLIGTRAGLPLDPKAWPRLRFRLRVDQVPTGTDLSRKKGDDAAFRIYVAFDRGGGLFSPPNTIAYTWTENLEPETLVKSPHYKRLRYLSVGKGVTKGLDPDASGDSDDPDDPDDPDDMGDGWVTIERNLVEDYRRVFGTDTGKDGKVPACVGFMLKCDSNNTETAASAWLADLELVSPEPDPARSGDS